MNRTGMRSALLGVFLAACQAPRPQVLLHVDTDLPVPSVADSLLVDVLGADGSVVESRNVVVANPTDWPVSIGVVALDAPVTLRLRAYRADRVGDPSLGSGPLDEPIPGLSIDRTVVLAPSPAAFEHRRVVLGGRCLGVHDETRTCVEIDGVATLVVPEVGQGIESLDAAPITNVVGTWADAIRIPCTGEERADSGLFDADVCVPGGVLFLGEERFRPLPCGPACEAWPEVPMVLSPFFVDAHEVTVGRWRAALDAGFVPPPASWAARSGTNPICTFAGSGAADAKAMNCVNLEAARAFCEFDGRTLVSEAQWDYVASGAGSEFSYPHGRGGPPGCDDAAFSRIGRELSPLFGFSPTYVAGSYNQCALRSQVGGGEDLPEGVAEVGTSNDVTVLDRGPMASAVVHDLIGNVHEWTLDRGQSYGNGCWSTPIPRDHVCTDGAADELGRPLYALRGGSWAAPDIRASVHWRDVVRPDATFAIGFRCARPGS